MTDEITTENGPMIDVPAYCYRISPALSREVINVVVPEYEARILEFMHGGPENVERVETDEELTVERDPDADAEWNRLVRHYVRNGQPNVVAQTFPLGARMLADFGFGESKRGKAKQAEASLTSIAKPKAKAKK